jgi:hypothetical protein
MIMATAQIPPHAQLSAQAEYRQKLFQDSHSQLQRFAWRATDTYRLTNAEFAVVCIQVDSRWRSLADLLMPHADWNAIRALGAEPIARGTVKSALLPVLAKEFPDLAEVIMEVPPAGKAKAIVLSDGGCTVYEIEPMDTP